MVEVRSGRKGLGAWHTETRIYLEGFRAILARIPRSCIS